MPTIGRQVSVRQTTIATSTAPQPSRIITQQPQHEPPVRGLLVDATGKPLRGLSKATIEAHKAHTENATEPCGGTCGGTYPPAEMTTVVGNAYNASNPLKLCKGCAALAYKNPTNEADKWKPSVPRVRFDRETAAPYDAHERGVSIKELVTKDTYHNEREVEAHYKQDTLVGEGRWSGGGRAGHVVTAESVRASRERASRRR